MITDSFDNKTSAIIEPKRKPDAPSVDAIPRRTDGAVFDEGALSYVYK